MSLTRVLRTTRTTITRQFYVDEQLTDLTTPSVEVRRLDGTLVEPAGTPTNISLGTYTFTPPATANVDLWTLDWLGTLAGASVSIRDYIENVGGFLFGLNEARAKRPTLSAAQYPTAELAAARLEAEIECEDICGQSFVTRFARYALSGWGDRSLVAPHAGIRKLRAVTVDGVAWSAPQVATVVAQADGELILPNGGTWPEGASNVVVEYEHGMWHPYVSDYPPQNLRLAAMIRMRSLLGITDTSVPYRAQSFTVQDGGVYRLSVAGPKATGIPDVDGPYRRYTVPSSWLS